MTDAEVGTAGAATSPTARRKDDHLRLAMAQHSADSPRDWDHVRFVHHALAGGNSADVSVASPAFGWQVPIYVSGMTGGTARAEEVRRGLGIMARELAVPVAVGSAGLALREPTTARTFTVLRQENPDGFVMANTNANSSGEDAVRLVELLAANALQVHLNAPQEIAMLEGDRDFSAWQSNLSAIIAAVEVPVIVKEVGAGLSGKTVAALRDLGVAAVDVAGRGGTDFTAIESARWHEGGRGYLAGWGQSAVCCLLEAADVDRVGAVGSHRGARSVGFGDGVMPVEQSSVALLASGGVRHALDVVRALALGADAVGVAGTFLRVLTESGPEALVALVSRWLVEIRDVMALLGARSIPELRQTDVLLTGPVGEYAELRGMDVKRYARRSTTAR